MISRLAWFCRTQAGAENFRLEATEPGPLGERQVILAGPGWIGPDPFPGDKAPILLEDARFYTA